MERNFLGLNWKEKYSKVMRKNSPVSEVEKSLYPSKLVSSSVFLPTLPFAKMEEQQQSIGGIKNVVPKPFSMDPNNGYRNNNNVVKLSGVNNAPLTIFYSGAVHVYHHISPQKAEAIMRIAGNRSSETKQIPKPPQTSSETLKRGGAIPMARKATLVRFLEKKRKARLIQQMPYNVSGKFVNFIPLPDTKRL